MMRRIENEECVVNFQDDMELFYTWAKDNNMSYNDTKFVILRYGRNSELKQIENWLVMLFVRIKRC